MLEFALLFTAVIAFVLIFRRKSGSEETVVWLDEGKKTKPLLSHQFQLVGKPDAVVRESNGALTLIEFKSRAKQVYESDIVQAKAAAIVMRENGFNVKSLRIKTATQVHKEVLPASNQRIYNDIQKYVSLARQALDNRPVPSYPNKFKCQYCSKKHRCTEKQ